MTGEKAQPPSWWKIDLYSYLTEIPLEGWVWEFMRRARLKELLGEKTIEAMHPDPDFEKILPDDPDNWNYYKTWTHSEWSRKKPVFLPPAVILSEGWPLGFNGQQYRINDKGSQKFCEIKIDLNRNDNIIKRDFDMILKRLRKDHEPPKRMNPRITDWFENHILESWDLKQYNLCWRTITNLLSLNSVQSARNAFNTASNFIDKAKWEKLARRVEK